MSKRNKLIEEHFKTNYPRLVKIVTRRVPHHSTALAEEVVMEAYSRALKYFRAFREEKNGFNTWFNGILRNATNDCCNAEKDAGSSKEIDENYEDVDFAIVVLDKENMLLFEKEIDKQSSRNRLILRLYFVYGFITKDIAQYLGMSHNNVRQVIFKFKHNVIL